MLIETNDNEIKLTFSKNIIELSEIQNIIDFIKFREISSKSQGSQKDADDLADEINNEWWKNNKHKFENESCN